MKKLPALIAGMITSGVLVLLVGAIGINALLNPNTTVEASAPGSAMQGSTVLVSAGADSSQVQQLQARIAEYQAREKQYQDQLDQVETNLQQANSELAQYQQLMTALQQAGVLRISRDGQVFLPRFDDND